MRLTVSFLECEFYTLDEDEFQNHRVVLKIIKNATSLITHFIKKARSITQGKMSTFQRGIFPPPQTPKEKAEALKSDLELPPNFTIQNPWTKKTPKSLSLICY